MPFGGNSSYVVPITDSMSKYAGFNQITVCDANAAGSGDPTWLTANCNYNTVLFVGPPALSLAVYGPQERTGPLSPRLYLTAGSPLTFVFSASTTSPATTFTIALWAAAASSSGDLRAATLVTTVATGLVASQSPYSWTLPSSLVYDSTQQYVFTLSPQLAPPAVVASYAPVVGFPGTAIPQPTLGGLYAQTAWGYTIVQPSATLTISNPQAGASYYLDQWAPISWSSTGLATTQLVYVELWYMAGINDPAVRKGG